MAPGATGGGSYLLPIFADVVVGMLGHHGEEL